LKKVCSLLYSSSVIFNQVDKDMKFHLGINLFGVL